MRSSRAVQYTADFVPLRRQSSLNDAEALFHLDEPEGADAFANSFDSARYWDHVLEFRDSFDVGGWQSLTNLPGTGSAVEFDDQTELAASPFYRIGIE